MCDMSEEQSFTRNTTLGDSLKGKVGECNNNKIKRLLYKIHVLAYWHNLSFDTSQNPILMETNSEHTANSKMNIV